MHSGKLSAICNSVLSCPSIQFDAIHVLEVADGQSTNKSVSTSSHCDDVAEKIQTHGEQQQELCIILVYSLKPLHYHLLKFWFSQSHWALDEHYKWFVGLSHCKALQLWCAGSLGWLLRWCSALSQSWMILASNCSLHLMDLSLIPMWFNGLIGIPYDQHDPVWVNLSSLLFVLLPEGQYKLILSGSCAVQLFVMTVSVTGSSLLSEHWANSSVLFTIVGGLLLLRSSQMCRTIIKENLD